MYNGRLSWHGNSGGKELVTSSWSSTTTTVVNGKVCSLINKYLSPSVESELLEELQTPNDSNGRRGSLPAELILCWKEEENISPSFLIIFSRHLYYYVFINHPGIFLGGIYLIGRLDQWFLSLRDIAYILLISPHTYLDELWLYILNSNFDLSNGRYCSSIYSRSLN